MELLERMVILTEEEKKKHPSLQFQVFHIEGNTLCMENLYAKKQFHSKKSSYHKRSIYMLCGTSQWMMSTKMKRRR